MLYSCVYVCVRVHRHVAYVSHPYIHITYEMIGVGGGGGEGKGRGENAIRSILK